MPTDVIRAKLAAGTLPATTPDQLWAGHGDGRNCDACDRPITASDVEWEADFAGGRVCRFHRKCLDAWSHERAGYERPIGGGAPCDGLWLFDRVAVTDEPWTEARFARLLVTLADTCRWGGWVRHRLARLRARSQRLCEEAAAARDTAWRVRAMFLARRPLRHAR